LLNCANAITDSDLKNEVLLDICKSLASAYPQKAIALVNLIDDAKKKFLALYRIAKVQAQLDSNLSNMILLQISTEAKHDQDPMKLAKVAMLRALLNPQSAEGMLATLSANIWSVRALCKTAKRYALTDPSVFNELLRRATNTCHRLNPRFEQAPAMTMIARAYALLDDEKAIQVAKRIPVRHLRESAFCEVAVAEALTHPDQAIANVNRLWGDSYLKAVTLCKMARAQALINPQLANEWIVEAKAISNTLQLDQDEILYLVSKVQALINVEEALSTAELIQDDTLKSKAFYQIVKAQVSINLEEAMHTQGRMTDPGCKLLALCEIIKKQISTSPQQSNQLFRQLLETESLSNASEKDRCKFFCKLILALGV
jgi:hypothetical protein